MESPVRIEIGVAVFLILLYTVRLGNGESLDIIQNMNTTEPSNISTSTSKTAFRGTTKYQSTITSERPEIIKSSNLGRSNNRSNSNVSTEASKDTTLHNNEVDAIQVMKDATSEKVIETINSHNKTKDEPIKNGREIKLIDDNLNKVVVNNKPIEDKQIKEEFDINKYVSSEFHDINNVYSQSVSPDIAKYVSPPETESSDYINDNGAQRRSDYYISQTSSSTTPQVYDFHRRFTEISESIKQNLADVDIDYNNNDNDNSTLKDVNIDFNTILATPLRNDSTLSYQNVEEIKLTNKEDENNKKGNIETSNHTKVTYEVSTESSNNYEHISVKTTVPDYYKINEITTTYNRQPKSSTFHDYDQKTENSVERRSEIRFNTSKKEYTSTTRMRSRTTRKPPIRISLTTQASGSPTETLSSKYPGAEIVKMQPFNKNRQNLNRLTSSMIDPVGVTAAEAVENFVSSLSKRGSTAEISNETTNKMNDSISSFSLPPTATAWALITFKNTPVGKRISPQTTNYTLDNFIKTDNEDFNAVNSSLFESSIEIKPTTPKKDIPTMEVGESNIDEVTSTSIFTSTPSPKFKVLSSTAGKNIINTANSNDYDTTTRNVEKSTTLSEILTTTIGNSVEKEIPEIVKTLNKSATTSTEVNFSTTPKIEITTTSFLDNNDISNVLVTQVTVQNHNTTSTVGTEINTESLVSETTTNDPQSTTPTEENNTLTTYSLVDTTTMSDKMLTTTMHSITTSDSIDENFSTQSTRSFIDEFSTTVKPIEDKTTTDTISTTTIDELDDFSFTSTPAKVADDTSTEASGDDDVTNANAKTSKEIPTTTVQYTSTTLLESLTNPTTIVPRITTTQAEKTTTRLLTTITTSLLPNSEDFLDSREGKNKVISEEEDKANIDDNSDLIDESSSETEIPIIPASNNKTDIDNIDVDENIDKTKDSEVIKTTTITNRVLPITTESNIEVINQNTHNIIPEIFESDSGETTTMFTEDDGTFDAISSSGTIAAITISAIGIVALVLLIGILLVAKGRRQGGGYGQRCTPVSLDSYSLDNVSVTGSTRRKGRRASKRSYGNPAYDEAGATSHPMQFAALANFAMNQEAIMNEFNDIPIIHARTEEVPPGCEYKNRFSNVIPLPETRVNLKLIPGDDTSEYINANYVRGPKCLKKYYIACQAPMASTVNDFWRMIWEQNARVVLMLTEYMENGMEKCYEYLPPSEVSDSRRIFGDYHITIKKRDVRDKYVISQLQLKNLNTKTWREITHMWYFWPAKGVPEECNSIIAFLLEARSYLKISQTSKEYDEDGHDSLITHNGSYANSVNVMENENETDVNIYNVQKGEKTSNGNSAPGTLTHPDGTKRGGPMIVHCSPGTGRTGTVIACDIGIRDFEMSRTVDVPKTVYRIRRDRANCVQTKDQYVFIYKVLCEYATKLTGGVLDSI